MPADDHLSPQQGRYAFHKDTHMAGSTNWEVHIGPPGDETRVSYLSIGHFRGYPETFTNPAPTRGVSRTSEGFTGPTPAWEGYDRNWHRAATQDWDLPQAPLFRGLQGYPPRDSVTELMSTKAARLTAPVLLGMAENESVRRTGQSLTTPRDLSRHSARMVQHLQALGAVPETAANQQQNEYSWYHPEYDPITPEWPRERVSSEALAAGKRTMRHILRSGRPKKPQGEQQRLF